MMVEGGRTRDEGDPRRGRWALAGAALGLAVLAVAAGCGGGDDQRTAPPVVEPPTLQAGHEAVAEFAGLAGTEIAALRETRIYYGHTSHGSQVVTGLQMLAARDASLAPPAMHEENADLGTLGDLAWAQRTRSYLDAHPGAVDLVLWSWCGGVSENTEAGIDTYLRQMETLEQEYPGVVFVRMTGHLDGTGPDGNLRARNDQIRASCREVEAPLFDFADIERHDPAGTEHPEDTDACQWCADWCATHDCPSCDSCAHSHCLNCFRKGQAFWTLLSRLKAAGRL